MKYYTKELYEEMQVYGFLSFPSSREEWEETLQSYKEYGIDYISTIRNDLEIRKPDLLKYLPKSMHPFIHNKTLMTEYPSSELKETGTQWLDNFEDRLRKIRKECVKNYKELKHKLPNNVVHLHENSLHDANVISFEYMPEKREFIMILNHLEDGKEVNVILTFTDVKDIILEDNIETALWLYDEVYIDGDYFELHVLFDSPLTDLCIKAQNLQIKKVNLT